MLEAATLETGRELSTAELKAFTEPGEVSGNGASDTSEKAKGGAAETIDNMTRARVFAIWLSIVCGVTCTFLDEGIIATAIPQITDEFHSLSDVGVGLDPWCRGRYAASFVSGSLTFGYQWYGSAYLLTLCAFQLVFGRLYSEFGIKLVYLASLATFELGSLLCALSPSSTAFIVGRAIAGCGGSGLMSGTIALFAAALPAKRLPFYIGAVGVVYGLASVLGPVVGGVITNSHLTWRWCFYINLPMAAPPAVSAIFFVRVRTPQQMDDADRPWTRKLLEFDYLGMLLLLPSITCLILALELGGARYGWSNGRTIGCFVAAGVLFAAFTAEQWWMGERALVPPRIIRLRIVLFASLYSYCLESAFLTLVYYIPLWFQAIQGMSAEQSGVRYLPLCIAFIIAIFGSGWIVTKIGYFQPFMLAGTILVSVGSGLLSTLQVSSEAKMWILYQVIAGLGIGLSTEQPSIAAQSLLNEADAPIGVAVVLFCRNLGPATFVSVANSIFARALTTNIRNQLPDFDPGQIMKSGATALRNGVVAGDLEVLLEAYNDALTRTFIVAACMGAASVLGYIGIGTQRIPTEADDSSITDKEKL